MAILIWNPSLNVNIDIIDTQHKKLFELANDFYSELYKGADKACLLVKIDELISYSNFHFQTEENLLVHSNYSGLPSHASEHKQFLDELTALKSRVISENMVISVEIINFLRNSIIDHIFVSDRNMAKFMVASAG
jgi:hemerythrin-like metal-binding domain